MLKFTILGCGSSSGVPKITGDWGACDFKDPKNYRQRCALLVQKKNKHGETNILIDIGPDIRNQLLKIKLLTINGVLLTHEHADHTHGIDDLRVFVQNNNKQIPIYMTKQIYKNIGNKFSYCFQQNNKSLYPVILKWINIRYNNFFIVIGPGGKIKILPIKIIHGAINVTGFLINGVMYTPDINNIPSESLYAFNNLNIWVVDALRNSQHVSHFSFNDAIKWIYKLRPKKSIITNMTNELNYKTIKEQLNRTNLNITPAYDGLIFKIKED